MGDEIKKELPATITIHKISSEQWRDYEYLRHEMLKSAPLDFTPKELEDLHKFEDTWRKRIKSGILIAAYDKINPIGYIRSKFFESKAKIHELFVKEDFKDFGLEEKLIEEVVGKIEDTRRVRVIEVLLLNNSSQIEIYKSLGFFEDEIDPKLKDKYTALKKPL